MRLSALFVYRQVLRRVPQSEMASGLRPHTARVSRCELVMLFAEPGRPHDDEVYGPKADPIELLLASVQHTYKCFRDCRDPFHENARCFLQQLYPKLSFDAQLRRVWIAQVGCAPTGVRTIQFARSATSLRRFAYCGMRGSWHSGRRRSAACNDLDLRNTTGRTCAGCAPVQWAVRKRTNQGRSKAGRRRLPSFARTLGDTGASAANKLCRLR